MEGMAMCCYNCLFVACCIAVEGCYVRHHRREGRDCKMENDTE